MLTRQAIQELAIILKREEVPIPEWGGTVLIQEFDAATKDSADSMFAAVETPDHAKGLRAKIVQLSVINEDGSPMFSEQDLPSMNRWGVRAVDRIFEASVRLNLLRERDRLQAIEDAAKKLPSGREDS